MLPYHLQVQLDQDTALQNKRYENSIISVQEMCEHLTIWHNHIYREDDKVTVNIITTKYIDLLNLRKCTADRSSPTPSITKTGVIHK